MLAELNFLWSLRIGVVRIVSEDIFEALYLVDDCSYLHLTETATGFNYEVYSKESHRKQFAGNFSWSELNGSPIQNPLAAARALALEDIGMDAVVVSSVALKMLDQF